MYRQTVALGTAVCNDCGHCRSPVTHANSTNLQVATAVLDVVYFTLEGFSGTSNHTGDYVRLRLTSESSNTADVSNMGSNSVDKNASGALEVRYDVARYAVNVFTSRSSVTSFLLP
jgi:hypothetical protein